MRKTITKKWLQDHWACSEAINQFPTLNKKRVEVATLIKMAVRNNNKEHLEWANWLISRAMTKKERIKYSIYAAKLILKNFESKHPEDKRPRKAIEAAQKYLNSPTAKNKAAANSAAYSAVYSSAYSAAYSAANSAAYSAYSAAWNKQLITILKYGLKQSTKGGKP